MELSLTANELRYLGHLAASGTATPAAVCKCSGMHPRTASRSSASLRGKGFVELVREGPPKKVRLADSKHAQLFRKLTLEHRHMRFDRLLSGSALEVLAAVSWMDLGSRKEIHENSAVSEASVGRVLSRLRRSGMVTKRGQSYRVPERFRTLADFALEFRRYSNQKLAQSFSRDAVIVLERNMEFIVETGRKEEEKGFVLTGPSAFGRFGVALFMPTSYHYRSASGRELKLEDMIIHSLLLPRSERAAIATLLVWKKNEKSMSPVSASKGRGVWD